VFDRFDRIRIISLRSRTDRRAEMLRELRKIGLADDPRVAFFDAIAPDAPGMFASNGYHGAFLSHLAVLRDAAQAGESVLVLEDDCDFLPGEYEVPECDVFYGGWLTASSADMDQADIVGAHCMGLTAPAAALAAAYFENLLDPAFPPDPVGAGSPGFNPAIRPTSDGAYVWFRRAHPHLVTGCVMMTTQRSSRSNVTPRWFFDRIPALMPLADLARRAKRMVMR
jgi:hypothetical protein